nr:EutP/PduV family microcompartment system protein [uncultured Acetobacterium sp.]
MKKMILVGRSECGKTTLRQALKGKEIRYEKTQYVNYYDVVIDTPGEYAENSSLARALALYSYESDIVALLISATEPYSLYPPCVTGVCNRPVIGIVTQIDAPDADVNQAVEWLELTGCEKIFQVSSYTGQGIWEILDYLKDEGDVLPWDQKSDAEKPRNVISTKLM